MNAWLSQGSYPVVTYNHTIPLEITLKDHMYILQLHSP